jgi:hypothetical protein
VAGRTQATGIARRSERGSREYRLYFAEPEIDRVLLAAFLGFKTAREMRERVGRGATPRSSDKQTKHVRQAMDVVVRWCRDRDLLFRTL